MTQVLFIDFMKMLEKEITGLSMTTLETMAFFSAEEHWVINDGESHKNYKTLG